MVSEVGVFFEDSPEFDNLFETIAEVKCLKRRDGEVRGARLRLSRGEQQVNGERYVDAIATLGRTLSSLYKHETRLEIVRALYLCGYAYDRIGLPWAARGTLLAAASIATNELWTYGDVTPYQAACYRQLKWVELRLGRLPQILAWHELDTAIRVALADRGVDPETLQIHDPAFDSLLIRLLLRTDFKDLSALSGLPDVLDGLGLDLPADALLFALGHTARMMEMANVFGDDLDTVASKWWNAESDIPLPDRPILYNQRKVSLASSVLGCHIDVESQRAQPCVEVAESLLAAIESFLATSTFHRAIAGVPSVTVTVRTNDFLSREKPIKADFEEKSGRPNVVVSCRRFNPHALSQEEQQAVRDALQEIAIGVIARFVMFKDATTDLERLFREERVAERAVAFTGTFGTQANVLGLAPKTRLSSWADNNARNYPVLRTSPWKPNEESNAQASGPANPDTPDENGLGPDGLDPQLASHEQMETVSFIRPSLFWFQLNG